MSARWPRWRGVVFVMVMVALVWVRWRTSTFDAGHARRDAAVAFCESLVVELDSYREKNGSYPDAIPDRWLVERPVPQLIGIDELYQPSASRDGYLLRFRDVSACVIPVLLCDGVYAFEASASSSGRWVGYAG